MCCKDVWHVRLWRRHVWLAAENLPWTVRVLQGQLEETFGHLHVWLAAENGIFMRPPPTLDEPEPVRFQQPLSDVSDCQTCWAICMCG